MPYRVGLGMGWIGSREWKVNANGDFCFKGYENVQELESGEVYISIRIEKCSNA